MKFIYKHLKSLVYLTMAVFAIAAGTLQLTAFYQNKKFIKAADEIGFVMLEGRNVILQSSVSKQQGIPTNGTALFSGDRILTYDHIADLQLMAPFDKVRVLPFSDATFYFRKGKVSVYLESGDVNVISNNDQATGRDTNIAIYKKDKEGQYQNYAASVSHLASGKYLHLTQINQMMSSQGPRVQMKWEPQKIETNAWVELWIGKDKDSLTLYKTFPYEVGSLVEAVSTDQFFWSMKLKANDEVLESSPVSYWKNEYVSQIDLLYPNENEVINDILKSDNISFKWSQALNISKPVVRFYSDDKQTKLVQEIKLENVNHIKYTPTKYGQYYWKVVDETRKIQSALRSFYYAPIVESSEEVISWDVTTEDKQFYYDKPVVYLKWNKNYQYPISKYKISFQYFQKNAAGESVVRQENIFTDRTELFFKAEPNSPLKIRVQAYNSKMQVLGMQLAKSIELSIKAKSKMLSYEDHQYTPKKELITDRHSSINFVPASVSALYKYNYRILNTSGEVARAGSFYKGQNLSLAGLPINYYKVEFSIEPRVFSAAFDSQFLDTNPTSSRAPASANQSLHLAQNLKVKLIPPVDFNVDKASAQEIITPQVQDVQVKE